LLRGEHEDVAICSGHGAGSVLDSRRREQLRADDEEPIG
jgi:hypothetical protein